MRTIILGSGNGTNAKALLDASIHNQLGATEIVAVYSDVAGSGILEVAQSHEVEFRHIDANPTTAKLSGKDEQTWIEALSADNPDLIVLAGFMKILQKPFLDCFPNSIINIHPSLLPSFKGLGSIENAYRLGVKITGCTIHWVNTEIDGGKIIAQAPVRIMEGDDLDMVAAKIQAAEHMLLPWVVSDLSLGNIPFPE